MSYTGDDPLRTPTTRVKGDVSTMDDEGTKRVRLLGSLLVLGSMYP